MRKEGVKKILLNRSIEVVHLSSCNYPWAISLLNFMVLGSILVIRKKKIRPMDNFFA